MNNTIVLLEPSLYTAATGLTPIDRRVYNKSADIEHALGARVVHALETDMTAQFLDSGIADMETEGSVLAKQRVKNGLEEARKALHRRDEDTSMVFEAVDLPQLPEWIETSIC